MPYTIRKKKKGGKSGYQVLKQGQVVAGKNGLLSLAGAKGYIWHAEQAERGKK